MEKQMSDWNQTIETVKIIGESVQRQVELINKSMKPVFEAIAKVQEFTIRMADIFSRVIYVTPEVYQFLLSLNVQISPEDIEKGLKDGAFTEEDLFIVFTRDESKKKALSFRVTKSMANAIEEILAKSPQYMSLDSEKIFFNREEPSLTINGSKLHITPATARYDLCKYMFRGKNSKKRYWELEDLVKALGGDYNSPDKDWYDYVYRKIRAFNKTIYEKIGYKNFFVVENTRFTINPLYIYLFSA